MTILNIVVEPGYALVGVDTAATDARSRKRHEASKFFVLPHVNAALAASGSMGVLFALLVKCATSPKASTFDDLSDRLSAYMSAAIDAAQAALVEEDPRLLKDPAIGLAAMSAFYVGWSDRLGRVTCHHVTRKDYGSGREWCTERNEGWLQPWQPSWGPTPSCRSVDDLVHVAREQTRAAREAMRKSPELAGYEWGGRFVVATLTRDRVTVETACELP